MILNLEREEREIRNENNYVLRESRESMFNHEQSQSEEIQEEGTQVTELSSQTANRVKTCTTGKKRGKHHCRCPIFL